jgi:hypothetical protein
VDLYRYGRELIVTRGAEVEDRIDWRYGDLDAAALGLIAGVADWPARDLLQVVRGVVDGRRQVHAEWAAVAAGESGDVESEG